MITPAAPKDYSQQDQASLRTQIEQADNLNHKKRQDVELGVKERLILRSPSGARWSITVSDAGALTATAL